MEGVTGTGSVEVEGDSAAGVSALGASVCVSAGADGVGTVVVVVGVVEAGDCVSVVLVDVS